MKIIDFLGKKEYVLRLGVYIASTIKHNNPKPDICLKTVCFIYLSEKSGERQNKLKYSTLPHLRYQRSHGVLQGWRCGSVSGTEFG